MTYYYGRNSDDDYYKVSEPQHINDLIPLLQEKELFWHGNLSLAVKLPPKMEARVIDAMDKDDTKLKAIYRKQKWQSVFDLLLGLGLTHRCTSWIATVSSNGNFDILFVEGGINNRALYQAFETGEKICTITECSVKKHHIKSNIDAYIPGWIYSNQSALNAYMAQDYYVKPITKPKIID